MLRIVVLAFTFLFKGPFDATRSTLALHPHRFAGGRLRDILSLQWIDGFNSGPGPLPEDVLTDDVVITDEFSPYVWIGKSAEHKWAQAIDAFIKPGNHHLSVRRA